MLNEKLQNDIARAEEQLHHALARCNYDVYNKLYVLAKGHYNDTYEELIRDIKGAYRVGLIDWIKYAEAMVGVEDSRLSMLNAHHNEMLDMYGGRETNVRYYMSLGHSREEAERLVDEVE